MLAYALQLSSQLVLKDFVHDLLLFRLATSKFVLFWTVNFHRAEERKRLSSLAERKRWNWWNYCWWKKSCTSWYGEYPIIYRGFLHPRYCRVSAINSSIALVIWRTPTVSICVTPSPINHGSVQNYPLIERTPIFHWTMIGYTVYRIILPSYIVFIVSRFFNQPVFQGKSSWNPLKPPSSCTTVPVVKSQEKPLKFGGAKWKSSKDGNSKWYFCCKYCMQPLDLMDDMLMYINPVCSEYIFPCKFTNIYLYICYHLQTYIYIYMGVSKNRGTPKSSIKK